MLVITIGTKAENTCSIGSSSTMIQFEGRLLQMEVAKIKWCFLHVGDYSAYNRKWESYFLRVMKEC